MLIRLFATRLGTALVALTCLAFLLLVFTPLGLIRLLPSAILFTASISAMAGSRMQLSHIRDLAKIEIRYDSSDHSDRERLARTLIILPLTKGSGRHNQKASLIIATRELNEKQRQCSALINDLSKFDHRIPILEAERDDARRRQDRLREDVRVLEEAWVVEDRERRYKQIVGH